MVMSMEASEQIMCSPMEESTMRQQESLDEEPQEEEQSKASVQTVVGKQSSGSRHEHPLQVVAPLMLLEEQSVEAVEEKMRADESKDALIARMRDIVQGRPQATSASGQPKSSSGDSLNKAELASKGSLESASGQQKRSRHCARHHHHHHQHQHRASDVGPQAPAAHHHHRHHQHAIGGHRHHHHSKLGAGRRQRAALKEQAESGEANESQNQLDSAANHASESKSSSESVSSQTKDKDAEPKLEGEPEAEVEGDTSCAHQQQHHHHHHHHHLNQHSHHHPHPHPHHHHYHTHNHQQLACHQRSHKKRLVLDAAQQPEVAPQSDQVEQEHSGTGERTPLQELARNPNSCFHERKQQTTSTTNTTTPHHHHHHHHHHHAHQQAKEAAGEQSAANKHHRHHHHHHHHHHHSKQRHKHKHTSGQEKSDEAKKEPEEADKASKEANGESGSESNMHLDTFQAEGGEVIRMDMSPNNEPKKMKDEQIVANVEQSMQSSKIGHNDAQQVANDTVTSTNDQSSKPNSSCQLTRSQQGDSDKNDTLANQQQRSLLRQTSSSRENSQKDMAKGSEERAEEQQLIECLPSQQNTYQQPSQPKQIIQSSVPPDRRCRLCWCCCCPCSGLSNKSNNNNNNSSAKNEIKATSEPLALVANKCQSIPNIPLEEIRLWGDSFDRLMKCQDGRKVFQDFLRCEYSEENILFWIACEELKSEKDLKNVATKARDIYEDYISILSAKEVSLDSRVRDVINNNIKKPTSNIFDEAQLQIYTLMHRDSYPRFINSPMYKKLAQIQTTSRKGSS